MKNVDYKTLEISLLSAENLEQVNHVSKMRVYAVVSVSDDPEQRRTDPDLVGGCNPRWNSSTFRFDVPAGDPSACLRITLRTERALGDRDVCRVTVPIRELLTSDRGDGVVESVRMRVRDSRGKETDGAVNFSYRILPGTGPPPAVPPPEMPPRGARHNGKSYLGLLMLEAIVTGLAMSPV